MTPRETFLDHLASSLAGATFAKLTLSKPSEKGADLRNLYARLVSLREGRRVQLVFRHARRDITRNVESKDAVQVIADLLGAQLMEAHLFTTAGDWHLKCDRDGFLKRMRPAFTAPPLVDHDRVHQPSVRTPQALAFLVALGVTDASGAPRPGMAGKLRQIDRFVELLGHMWPKAGERDAPIRVADMGAGKGYLTFAMAEYFRQRGVEAEIVGVETRADLVEHTNRVASATGYGPSLRFEQGAIGSWAAAGKLDLLVALHACNTATDDALHQGILSGAGLILASPCCHQELRSQIITPHPLGPIMRHGILAEREAEILTDAIRALILEVNSYVAEVFEFISTEHTGKNLMLCARKIPLNAARQSGALDQLHALMAFWGIRTQRLAQLTQSLPSSHPHAVPSQT